MPPVRSISSIKPIKTERTHEENQERAYIAASRRSDRSLEARVESARRASEIHKRRTGRSLRVTEQDVVNEEMYEEEDDDLPMQYRRLTAHLTTADPRFNYRIQAAMAQSMAMRQALANNSNMNANWAMNGGQFNNNFMNPQMMLQQPSGFQQYPYMPTAFASGENATQSRMPQRHGPYPTANNRTQDVQRPNFQGRALSIASPQEFMHYGRQKSSSSHDSPVGNIKLEDRRMSMPVHNLMPQTPQSLQSPTLSRNGSSSNLAATPQGYMKPSQSPEQKAIPPRHQQRYSQDSAFSQNDKSAPFSSQLAPNMQQMFANNPAAVNDPMVSGMVTAEGMNTGQRSYSYNPNRKPKPDSPAQQFGGLHQTLTMGALDGNASGLGFDFNSFMPPESPSDSLVTPTSNFDFSNNNNNNFDFMGENFNNMNNFASDADMNPLLFEDFIVDQGPNPMFTETGAA